MTDKEMAMKIATVILGQQIKEMAYVSELEQYPPQWKENVDLVTGSLLLDERYQNRISEIDSALSKANSSDALQILYRELFAN
jgi:hypothetical protein